MLVVLIFLTTFFSTMISSMSGGGSNIIAIPVFLMLGLTFPAARVIQLVNGAFWVPVAAYNYLKGRKLEYRFVAIFALVGLLGMYAGAKAILLIPERPLKFLVGCLILLAVLLVQFRGSFGIVKHEERSRLKKMVSYPFALILGFYEAILGSGNAIFFSILTCETRGYDFVAAFAAYYIIAFCWDIFGLAYLYRWGHVDVSLLIFGVIGAMLGAYVGSRYARAKGNAFIKSIFVVIGIVLAAKLIFFP
jgi:uncharacterized membrane protein YfcA